MVDSPNSRYLYSEIKERIKEDTKDLPPHTRIDTRMAMIKKYNVTRTTIEKAISALIGESYLYSIDGSGTYIAEKPPAANESSVKSWGVILPTIVSDTYPEILRGIEDVGHEHKVNVVICNTDNDVGKQDHYVRKLVESGVQGIMIVPAISAASAADTFSFLAEKAVPFVFCNRGVHGVQAPRVLSNNFFGAYMATKHLIGLGYKRIGFISKPHFYSLSEQRYQGYLGALSEAGLPILAEYASFENVIDAERTGFESGLQLLRLNPRPEAIFCFNDEMAKGAYEAAESLGLRIGVDLGIVGYDDSEVCNRLPVKLTSVRYPKYESGKQSAQILLRLIQGEQIDPSHTVILQPELIVRQSCGIDNRQAVSQTGGS